MLKVIPAANVKDPSIFKVCPEAVKVGLLVTPAQVISIRVAVAERVTVWPGALNELASNTTLFVEEGSAE